MALNIRLLIDLCWLATALVWVATAWQLKPAKATLPPGQRTLQIALLFVGAVLLFSTLDLGGLLQTQVIPQQTASAATGIALAATGNAIAIAARLYLGGNWSNSAVIRQEHQLIRSGPYAWVRHPIYSGMTLAVCGSALGFGELRHLIAVPVLLTAFRLKQLSEENLLLQSFGQKYLTYRCAVRWAIIPFVL
jgi:protein-S-isoprenylcysteine O-methyltransferase Ste14